MDFREGYVSGDVVQEIRSAYRAEVPFITRDTEIHGLVVTTEAFMHSIRLNLPDL